MNRGRPNPVAINNHAQHEGKKKEKRKVVRTKADLREVQTDAKQTMTDMFNELCCRSEQLRGIFDKPLDKERSLSHIAELMTGLSRPNESRSKHDS